MSTNDSSIGEAITAKGLEELRAELAALETTGRAEIAKRISSAREMGDLKENAEYHIAKEDQGHMETKILRLQARLRAAVVVEAPSGTGAVGFGSTVELVDEDGGPGMTWTIVGPTEADIKQKKLSSESPIALAVMDKATGEIAEVETPKGVRRLRIASIS
ncbi:MAG: transcription elongation factor GreA [Solirubrobacterales bacterium]|nr:transcription elongation factor GreA [Solirubrobacterales bacterium]